MARKLWKDESGVTTVEYALLLGIMVVGAVTVWTTLRGAISAAMTQIADSLN